MKHLQDFNIKDLSTLALNAQAKNVYFLETKQDYLSLAEALNPASLKALRFFGLGSNVAFAPLIDSPIAFSHIPTEIQCISQTTSNALIQVTGAYKWHDLVKDCLRLGYHGLEPLALIPGGLGGAVVQNIGAYGIELKQSLVEVEVFDWETQTFQTLSNKDCQLSYRSSLFHHQRRHAIVSATFSLSLLPSLSLNYPALIQALGKQAHPQEVFDWVVKTRLEKIPSLDVFKSAGSFFKNPIVSHETLAELLKLDKHMPHYPHEDGFKVSAAYLIEQAGFPKSYQLPSGGAALSDSHTLILGHKGEGTFQGIQALASQIEQTVWNHYHIKLASEVELFSGA